MLCKYHAGGSITAHGSNCFNNKELKDGVFGCTTLWCRIKSSMCKRLPIIWANRDGMPASEEGQK
jgi:hypothetical protein